MGFIMTWLDKEFERERSLNLGSIRVNIILDF